jgi:Holliday junction DNA helicase RuvA
MIGHLQGRVFKKSLNVAIVDVGGVGYQLRMPLSDLARLGEPGSEVGVHVHTHVRADAIELFGFLEEQSLGLFERLIGISGIGPRLALTLLSGMEPEILVRAVRSGDVPSLTRVPGVGKKTAERIVLELKDKLAKDTAPAQGPLPGMPPMEDLRSALENLGYKSAQVDKAIAGLSESELQSGDLQTLVRKALGQLR